MKEVIFRQYDIRGKVGSELIIDEVYDLGCAIAYYFLQRNRKVKKIIVGMDGRHHSPPIKQQLCQALIDNGLDVIFIGICPSPVVYFALHTMPVDAGLMITASHNPKEYNGIKICLEKEAVWGNEIIKIREFFLSKKRVIVENKGTITEQQVIPTYINWLADHFSHLKGMPIKTIIDCGNATGGTVMPQLIEVMQWPYVQLLYAEVDGDYPHHEADPIVEENMADVKKILQETDLQIGLGLDGDCDRMAPMTKDGYLVPGDQLLTLFAQPILEKHPGAVIVFDVKASSAVIELLEKWGAEPIMSPTGHALIKDAMIKYHALLGGELSCHFFFADRYFGYDDAIYATLRLFELLMQSGKILSQLLSVIPPRYSSPEYRIACKEEEKQLIVAKVRDYFLQHPEADVLTIDGVRVTLPYGWGLIRASNTQSVLSLRFESYSSEGLQKIKQKFVTLLQEHIEPHELNFGL